MDYRIIKKGDRYYPQVFGKSQTTIFSWKKKWRNMVGWFSLTNPFTSCDEREWIEMSFKTEEECEKWMLKAIGGEAKGKLKTSEAVCKEFTA
jgi:hypothetical protein